ncbi:MAG TPA: glycosyltransferase [Gemmatimonadaceae bacterium]
MRIVAHNGARIWGGAERATVSLLQGLLERGHDVLLLCNSVLVVEQSMARGVPARLCPIGGDIALHHAWRIRHELEREKPDVFIVGTFKKLFLAALGARMAGVPRVIARVGLESDTPRSIKYRIALRRWTDGVVVNAERMMQPFQTLSGFDRSKVTLIWNSVPAPVETQRSRNVRRELRLDDSVFVTGAVARLSKQKRLDRLVEAMSQISGAHCVIAGDGKYRDDLAALAARLGVERRVHLLGERDDVDAVLDALDVYAVTSDSEGMSNAMLEAMARGLPVVSTDVSGAEDALGEDESGAVAGIIVPFDSTAVAKALQSLRDSTTRRNALAREARLRALTWFSRDKMLTDWEEFLSQRA